MSGRRLGRLLGSLLAFAAVLSGFLVGEGGVDLGNAQTADIIWNMPAPR
ncbi:hypothetical protein ACGFI9_27830 [Micromonospora sp. NPDC048930]